MLAQRHALTAIHAEHRVLARVLHVLKQCSMQLPNGVAPELTARMNAALEYIEAFPDRFHHPKEEEYLFARLRLATHEIDEVLEKLEEEHRKGEVARRRLKEGFARVCAGETMLIQAFVADVNAYVHFQFAHMRVEEGTVLPLAARTLSPNDWHAIASAFLNDSDARFGWDAQHDFANLLLRVKPAPIASRKK